MKYLAGSDIWRVDETSKMPNPQVEESKVLGRFAQVFPLTLFPDELIVEERRIVHVKRNGPWADEVISIMAGDIASVNAAAGPFFGHIHVQNLTGGPEIMIDCLLRGKVFKIRSLIEGLELTSREGLKINDLNNIATKRQLLLRAGSI